MYALLFNFTTLRKDYFFFFINLKTYSKFPIQEYISLVNIVWQ